jgi:maltose alpha-D-glucosyltransferase/alpha-amylase
MLRNLRERLTSTRANRDCKLEFRPTSKFDDSVMREPDRIRAFESEFPSSSALVDHSSLQAVPQARAGIHPGIEMGHFLTEVAAFANTPALLGSAELIDPDGGRSAIATLHAQIQNQGDACS